MRKFTLWVNLYDCQDAVFDTETDIISREGQAVDSFRVVLVGGTRVVPKNAQQSLSFFCRYLCQKIGREFHIQQKFPGMIGKAAQSLRKGIAIGNVGLNVKYRRPVHQIGTAYVEHCAKFFRFFHIQKPDAGQAQTVWAERGTGSEYAHAGISAQPGRAHGG